MPWHEKMTQRFGEMRVQLRRSARMMSRERQPDSAGSFGIREMGGFLKSTLSHAFSRADPYARGVPNDYDAMWVDPLMFHSCGWFEQGDEDLVTAQRCQIDRVLAQIDIKPGQQMLDVDCGWGALVIRAAQQFGVRCVGVTHSKPQFDWAVAGVKAAGLADRVEIRLRAYPDAGRRFDRIASLGMLEYDDCLGHSEMSAFQPSSNVRFCKG